MTDAAALHAQADGDAADRIAAALGYGRRGWRVIPLHGIGPRGCRCIKGPHCPTPGKHPLGERWQTHATTDAAQILRW